MNDEHPTSRAQRIEDEADDSVFPTLTVKRRVQDEWTDEGDKLYVWDDIVTDRAVAWTTRSETDGSSGVTVEHATAVVLYSGTVRVTETASVHIDGTRYRVVSVAQFPDRLEFDLIRAGDGDQ